jgi:hypothetical protein
MATPDPFAAVRLPESVASLDDPAATVLSGIRTIDESFRARKAIIEANTLLSPEGKDHALFPFAEEARTSTAGLLKGFEPYGAALQAEAETIAKSGALPVPTSDFEKAQQLELAKIVGAMTPQQRAKRMEAWARGEDRDQLAAVLNNHYSISGLQERTWQMLRESEMDSRIDPVKREQLTKRAEVYGILRRALEGRLLAYEGKCDREALKKSGQATTRKSDLKDDKAKSDYIDQHGLNAFMALPA